MNLTTDFLQKFVGGQMETQNQNEGYLYRGEIAAIEVTNGELKVELAWLAKGEGYPPLPEKWVAVTDESKLHYAAGLEIVRASQMGERITFQLMYVWETNVLFPPGDSKLEPEKVEGLTINA